MLKNVASYYNFMLQFNMLEYIYVGNVFVFMLQISPFRHSQRIT